MVYRMLRVMVLQENVQTRHSWEGLRVVTKLPHLFPSPTSTSKAARLPAPGPFLVLSYPTQDPSHLGTRLQAHRRGKVILRAAAQGVAGGLPTKGKSWGPDAGTMAVLP